MSVPKAAAVEQRLDRKWNHRLRDELSRELDDPALELLALFRCRGWSDEHAVATGSVDSLDNQLLDVLEHVLAVGLDRTQVGLDVGQDGVLVEVVLDDLGH